MKYNQVKRDTNRVLNKIRGYLEVIERNGYLNINYAPVLNTFLSEVFKCAPLQISQSLLHLDLYDAENPNSNRANDLRRAIWRLAANKDLLQQGMSVPYYSKFTADEEIIEVRFTSCVAAKQGRLDVKAICITGHFAPNVIKFNLTEGSVQRILRNIGYNNRQYPLPTVYNSLNGLYARLHVKLDENNVLRLKDVIEDDTLTQYNRKNIIKYRCGNTVCPHFAGKLCSECDYTRHTCVAAPTQSEDIFYD